MTISVSSIDEYIQAVPGERREAFYRLRAVINDNLPRGFEECMSYNMPSWAVPHSLYPAGYHCKPEEPLPFLSVGNQKNYIGFYHHGMYARPDLLEWFQTEWQKLDIGKLDMGKSCVRLKKMNAIPYDLLGELCRQITPQEWIAVYEKRKKHQ